MQASPSVRDEFWALDEKFLGMCRKSGSVNTIDQLPSEYYDTGWESIFGKVLPCGEHDITSSAISFVASEHPFMEVSIANGSASGSDCSLRALAYVPHTGGGIAFTGATSMPRHQYILDFPVWGDKNAFGLRFHLWSAELRQLNQGFLPPWKSFAIDNPSETIQLQLSRRGADWTPIPRLQQYLPEKILLRTGLESEGPWIVREYKLTSHTPRQIGPGDDASHIFVWAFTWQRAGYAEQPNSFAGVEGKPRGSQVQDVRK